MSTAGAEISTLSVRVRDPQLTAITEPEWLQLLSRSQAAWNAATMRTVASYTLTLEPFAPCYPINALIPDCIRILSVHDGDHELHRVRADSLKHTSPTWLRDQSTDPEEWTLLGRDLLIIYPAVDTAHTLTITYVQHTPDLAALTDELAIPEHDLPGFRDFTEAIACLKLRQLKLMEAAATRIKGRMSGQ